MTAEIGEIGGQYEDFGWETNDPDLREAGESLKSFGGELFDKGLVPLYLGDVEQNYGIDPTQAEKGTSDIDDLANRFDYTAGQLGEHDRGDLTDRLTLAAGRLREFGEELPVPPRLAEVRRQYDESQQIAGTLEAFEKTRLQAEAPPLKLFRPAEQRYYDAILQEFTDYSSETDDGAPYPNTLTPRLSYQVRDVQNAGELPDDTRLDELELSDRDRWTRQERRTVNSTLRSFTTHAGIEDLGGLRDALPEELLSPARVNRLGIVWGQHTYRRDEQSGV